MIELLNISKSYGQSTVLKDMSMVINDGDIIAVIGPSGCGKSTLMRCIIGRDPPTSGKVLYNGTELIKTGRDLPKSCEKMGMVFQNFNLFPHMTVLENVMVPQIRVLGKSRQEAYDKAISLLRKVGLASRRFEYPEVLSGGQKQRAAIARTLAMDPEVVFFDEPTSLLDPLMTEEVEHVIAEIAGEGITMMIVTHNMEFARNISNRVLYLDDGCVYEDGSPEQIFDNPKKPKTKAFIRKLRVYSFEIFGKDYDFPEFVAGFKQFCAKQGFERKEINAALATCDEIINGIIAPTLNEASHILMQAEHSESTGETIYSISYSGDRLDPHDTDDFLRLKLIEHYTGGFLYEFLEDEEMHNRVTVVKRSIKQA
ncbi:MAG: amino acid ABC transporter ATP-binding protein [Lachnospiraceae bacterium]|nr:amino acid ABC transporter ATP-binding protein [Lachnospiraceae bacterium]